MPRPSLASTLALEEEGATTRENSEATVPARLLCRVWVWISVRVCTLLNRCRYHCAASQPLSPPPHFWSSPPPPPRQTLIKSTKLTKELWRLTLPPEAVSLRG